MNTKYVLPTSLAVTLHAFLLFGVPGKPPALATPAPEAMVIGPISPRLIEVPLEPPPRASDDERAVDPGGGAPSLGDDIPVVHPFPDAFFIRPTTRIDGPGRVTAIPVDWNRAGSGGAGSRIEVIDPRFLDHEPRARVQPAPDYPYDARRAGLDGTVVVEFLVDEAGNVYAPVVRSATATVFVDAALRAVRKWKFEPGKKNGRPVRFRMMVPIEFRVGDG
jgi:periplasmic protein TonB